MKRLLYIAALALCFVACEKQEPFDTQDPNDDPLILKPYNESGTGSFTYDLANPDTPLLDSVTVTPSAHTIVNWYLDGQRVYTGTRIEMTFPAGKYALTIEAVTSAGKRTERTGSVTVHPYATDPYAAAPAGGRHMVPGLEMAIDGANLDKVKTIELTKDLFSNEVVATATPSYKAAAQLKVTLPATEDGEYYLRFEDEAGAKFGSEKVSVHNGAVALDGFASFVPGDTWTITGVNLQSVASVKVDEITITELIVTETSVTFIAPTAEVGEHTLSMANADGSAVLFVTNEGTLSEVKTIVSAETTLWEGSVVIDWNADLLRVSAAQLADVPEGATILVYYTVPEAEYHALRITNPAWSDDYLAQVDGMGSQPNPYTFTFDAGCKALASGGNDFCVVGFGLQITKITYK